MSRILIISGHPNIEASFANRTILDEVKKSVTDVEIRYLDKLYTNFAPIDINAEQEALLKADIIILQFPLYWYSTPSLLKFWLDEVFTFGFAFGPHGSKLEGKKFLTSVTVGSAEENYQSSEVLADDKSIDGFLKPLYALAKYSSLTSLDPVCSFGMAYLSNIQGSKEDVAKRAKSHANRLVKILNPIT